MGDGYKVDLQALRRAAAGVNGTLDEAEKHSVSEIPHEPSQIGHDQLASTLSDFFDRWGPGVKTLEGEARNIASALDKNAADYGAVDAHVHDGVSGIVQGTGPDPGEQ